MRKALILAATAAQLARFPSHVTARLAAATAAQLALPSTALACTWCVASAFGDRTFNWPYLSLIIMPFVVAVAIGGALAYYAGVRPRTALDALRRSISPLFELFHRTKETT